MTTRIDYMEVAPAGMKMLRADVRAKGVISKKGGIVGKMISQADFTGRIWSGHSLLGLFTGVNGRAWFAFE